MDPLKIIDKLLQRDLTPDHELSGSEGMYNFRMMMSDLAERKDAQMCVDVVTALAWNFNHVKETRARAGTPMPDFLARRNGLEVALSYLDLACRTHDTRGDYFGFNIDRDGQDVLLAVGAGSGPTTRFFREVTGYGQDP